MVVQPTTRRIRIPCHRDPSSNAAIYAFAAQPGLYRHYEGQEVGGAHRTAKGAGDGGAEQPDGESVFGVAGQVDGPD